MSKFTLSQTNEKDFTLTQTNKKKFLLSPSTDLDDGILSEMSEFIITENNELIIQE